MDIVWKNAKKIAEYIQNQLKEVKCTINYDPIFLTLIV